MGTALQISDRGYRYRANQAIPPHAKVCVFCGSRSKLMVAHLDGHEENPAPENLSWSCRSCNSAAASVLNRAGMGRLTRQYNPTKSGGASSVGEWLQAVGAITPHVDRGDRGLASDMSVSEAVAIIRATPHSKRSEFASKLRGGRGRANPAMRQNLWPFSGPKERGTTPAAGGLAKFAGQGSVTREKKTGPVVLAKYKGYRISKTPEGEYFSSLDPDSWFESLPNLKRFIDGWEKGRVNPNPSKFDRCVRDVEARGGAANAYAVCTAAGLRGVRRNPKRVNALARSDRAALRDLRRYGSTIARAYVPGLWETSSLVDAFKNPSKRKRNPAAEAEEVYEEFHGQSPAETITVEKQVHFHEHLAAAGELRKLVVKAVNHQVVTLTRFKGALLCFNEAKNQLFVEGGDQSVGLAIFGIREDRAHEMETLGKVVAIDYHTNKTHLGDEGGEATYEHTFRTTNEFGQHVTVKIARYPDLIYSVPSEQLYFSGGSYFIRAEGIDQ